MSARSPGWTGKGNLSSPFTVASSVDRIPVPGFKSLRKVVQVIQTENRERLQSLGTLTKIYKEVKDMTIKKSLILILFLAFLPVSAFCANFSNVTAGEAKKGIKNQTYDLILDVRTPEEYTGEMGHIRGSRLIPIQELNRRISEVTPFKDKGILVYCAVGGRSARAARLLAQIGFSRVKNMLGGIVEWNRLGYPVEK